MAKRINAFLIIIKIIVRVNIVLFLLLMVINIINGILPFMTILLTGKMIDALSLGDNKTIGLFICLSIVILIGAVFKALYSLILNNFQMKLSRHMEEVILNKIEKIKFSAFEDSETYDRMVRATQEATTQPVALLNILLSISKYLIQIISVITILLQSQIRYLYLLLIFPIILGTPYICVIYKEYLFNKKISDPIRRCNYYRLLLTRNENLKEIKQYDVFKNFKEKFYIILI